MVLKGEINIKIKMLLSATITLVILGTSQASFYPPDCQRECECNRTTVICAAIAIPDLDKRLTHFVLNDAKPLIKRLDGAMTQKMDHLVSLELTSVGLESIEGGALSKITLLEDLKFTHNNIKVLENSAFENCSQLVNLNLEKNNIETIENNAFISLDALERLTLANNFIAVLPSYFPPKITTFNIEGNQIRDIRDFSFKQLTSLNLCNNNISSAINIKTEMKHLTELCLGGPYLEIEPDALNQDKFPVLHNLKLAGNHKNQLTISTEVTQDILNMTSNSLKVLIIEFSSLENLNFSHENSKLQEIRLSNVTYPPTRRTNKIILPPIKIFDVSGSPALASKIVNTPSRNPMTELETLRMSRCNIKRLHESLLFKIAPKLSKLDISHNPLHCSCSGLSWVKKRVFQDKLSLIQEEDTICASPEHLQSIPLLTATMCPINESLLKMTTNINVTTNIPSANPTTEVMLNPEGNTTIRLSTINPLEYSNITTVPPISQGANVSPVFIIIPIIIIFLIVGVIKYWNRKKAANVQRILSRKILP